ncbi:hypothetical protein BKA56DRAFT_654170 [Ilyonectria sp. MPI-CAGE-AT-0026]|nr:hypothetical protein BKA56DRAFT_654170 [Ilyonectria sp. MPI-CAGE-AT-0026]
MEGVLFSSPLNHTKIKMNPPALPTPTTLLPFGDTQRHQSQDPPRALPNTDHLIALLGYSTTPKSRCPPTRTPTNRLLALRGDNQRGTRQPRQPRSARGLGSIKPRPVNPRASRGRRAAVLILLPSPFLRAAVLAAQQQRQQQQQQQHQRRYCRGLGR